MGRDGQVDDALRGFITPDTAWLLFAAGIVMIVIVVWAFLRSRPDD